MKAAKTAAIFAALMTIAPSAFASAARSDNSGIVVWGFLGLCALIVVAQLVPAVLMLFGIVKGVASKPEESLEKASN